MKSRIGKLLGVVAIVIFTAMVVTACGDETMRIGNTTSLKSAEITPVNIIVSKDSIYPPKGSGKKGYGVKTEGMNEVALLLTIKNTTDDPIDFNSGDVSIVLEQGGEQYTDWYAYLLEKDDSLMSSKGTIAPHGTERLYILIDVAPETRGAATIRFDLRGLGNQATLECDTKAEMTGTQAINKKDTLTAEGTAALTLRSAKLQKKGRPTKASKDKGYTYWSPKKGDFLLDVLVDLENLTGEPIQADKIAGAMVFIDGEMSGSYCKIEMADGKDFARRQSIAANKKHPAHFFASIPKESKDAVTDIYIYFDGSYYQYSIEE